MDRPHIKFDDFLYSGRDLAGIANGEQVTWIGGGWDTPATPDVMGDEYQKELGLDKNQVSEVIDAVYYSIIAQQDTEQMFGVVRFDGEKKEMFVDLMLDYTKHRKSFDDREEFFFKRLGMAEHSDWETRCSKPTFFSERLRELRARHSYLM